MNDFGLIPIVSTLIGNCLTFENWLESGVTHVSYHFSDLMIKPGAEILESFTDISTFTGWHAPFVLNAYHERASEQQFMVRSPYDGRVIRYTMDDILLFAQKCSPVALVLPPGIYTLKNLPEKTVPFFPVTHLPEISRWKKPFGIHHYYDSNATNLSGFFEQLEQYNEYPAYVSGDLDFGLMKGLKSMGVQGIETNRPVLDAIKGIVYTDDSELSLSSSQFEFQFEAIASSCLCPSCRKPLTRAYFHHLLEQTPLLCHRFLAQHNAMMLLD